MRGKIAALGEVMQLAYVPSDFEGTLRFWIETMGAGPFFLFENVRFTECRYRGIATDPIVTIALGHWGDMEIEIIRQNNSMPSPCQDWRMAGREGIHHVCIVVEDLEPVRRACTETGAIIVQEARLGGAEYLFIDTRGGPGTMVEVLKHSPETKALLAMIRDAARDWDGEDPIRFVTDLN